MAALTLDAVAIVGLGLIGGSLARALLACGVSVHGWTQSPRDLAAAAAAGVRVLDMEAIVRGDDAALRAVTVVVLAVPIDAMAPAAVTVLPHVAPETLVLHVGGLQSQGAVGLSDEDHARVFGTHPIAGSHAAGFGGARADLFAGATISLESRLAPRARAVASSLWRAAGAERLVYRDAAAHDRLMAWVSHLPQVAATALAATLGEAFVSPLDAGPGARDTTRLAACEPEAWRPLMAADREELLRAIDALERTVARMRLALGERDDAELADVAAGARRWRNAAAPGA